MVGYRIDHKCCTISISGETRFEGNKYSATWILGSIPLGLAMRRRALGGIQRLDHAASLLWLLTDVTEAASR